MSFQYGRELGAQVVDHLHPHRQPHQRIADAQLLALRGRDGGMGHDGRVLDQALHAAERFGQGKQVAAFQHAARFFESTLHLDADDAAEALHLAARQGVLRVALEAGVDHALDARVLLEPARQFQRVVAVRAHAQVQGLESAQGEKTVERPGDGADRVLQECHRFGQIRCAGHDDAADHVGMAVEVLGGRVQHQVRAVLQRALQHGRAEGVVHHQDQPVLARERGHLGQIHQPQHGVGGRLCPDHARVGLERGLQRGRVVEIDEAEVEPGRTPAHALEQTIGAAVQIVPGDDVAAGVQQLQHGAGRGQARGEGEARHATFQIGHAALVGEARGVVRARVFVALVLAGTALYISRRGIDRRHDRAGRGVGTLAGVDGAGAEAQLHGCVHSHGPDGDNPPIV